MAGSIIVGFSAAGTAGASAGHTFAGAEAGTDAGASPLGLFGALLGAVAPVAEGAAADAVGLSTGKTGAGTALAVGFAASQPTEIVPAPVPAPGASNFPADAAIPPADPALVAPDAAAAALPDPATAAPDPATALLIDLANALSGLEAALQGGEPVDPALHQKLEQALDALAAFFGLPPSQTGTPLPAAQPAGDGPDPLQALAAARAALVGAAPADGASDPLAPVVGGAAAGTAGTAASGAAQPSPVPGAITDPVAIGHLIDRLDALSARLQAVSPGLADKLEAISRELASGALEFKKVAAAVEARLVQANVDLADVAEAMLSVMPPAKPAPVPAPQPFAAAALAVPEDIALPPQERPAPPPANLSGKPSLQAPAEAPLDPEIQPSAADHALKRQDTVDGRAANRQGFGAGPAAAEPPLAADAKPSLPATAAPAAVAAAAAVTAGAKAIHAAYQAPIQQVNVPQVAFEMVRQFQAGNSRFQIRLDPPELGRIDVRMNMDRDGNVHARMTVERSETLDLMQRDQRALEKALAQAGLDGAKTNLEFSLRQSPSDRDQRGSGNNGGSPFGDNGSAEAEEPASAPVVTQQYRGSASAGGVNLFV